MVLVRTIKFSPLHAKPYTSVLATLAYFDLFHHPLTIGELSRFAPVSYQVGQLENIISELLSQRVIYRLGEFYSLSPNYFLQQKRELGNSRAEKLLPGAKKIGRFLFQFPFVKAIAISGSLSKNYSEKNGDVDFFIITAVNRLWIARSLMHAYKKLMMLLGRQHLYCMNYYVDESALVIAEQNFYTAVEITTVIPCAGAEAIQIAGN
ncbi:MAG: hypothetical protein C4308_10130 [Chitinophagaceae bacterium]